MSTMKQIAESVVAHLQGMTGMPSGAVVYRHLEELDGDDFATLRVVVTPAGLDVTNAARGKGTSDYRIGVYVAKRVASHTDSAAMLDTVENIIERLRTDTWSSSSVAFNNASVELLSEDGLEEAGLFRAKVEATFKRVTA